MLDVPVGRADAYAASTLLERESLELSEQPAPDPSASVRMVDRDPFEADAPVGAAAVAKTDPDHLIARDSYKDEARRAHQLGEIRRARQVLGDDPSNGLRVAFGERPDLELLHPRNPMEAFTDPSSGH